MPHKSNIAVKLDLNVNKYQSFGGIIEIFHLLIAKELVIVYTD